MQAAEPPAQELRISADSHMGEPPDLWERELPARFRSRALQFDERPFETNHHLRAGCWDPHERLKDLALDGVCAEVLYPTLAVRAWLIDDLELQEAHLRVYNDWMIDFCSVAPHRYWGLGMVSLWNVDNAIEEMRRFMKADLRRVDIWIAPPRELPYSSERYEPFWAAAQDLGASLNMHINGRAEARPRDPAAIPLHSINGHKFDAMDSLLHIIGSGVLERYPRLQVAVAETGAGWAPFWLQEADHYTMSRRTTLPMPPSEYFKRQVACTFISDAVGAYLLRDFGRDNVMWSNDYPHPACTWPDSHILIILIPEDLGDLPSETCEKVVWRTAARIYNGGEAPAPPDPPGDRAEVERWLEDHRDFGASARPKHRVGA